MTDTVYDFVVPGKKKTEKNLADYKGKVLLIVTPQVNVALLLNIPN